MTKLQKEIYTDLITMVLAKELVELALPKLDVVVMDKYVGLLVFERKEVRNKK